MPIRSRSLAAAILLAAGVLTGCSNASDRATDPSVEASEDEISAHDGEVCPEVLPEAGDEYGFGTSEPATSSPTLATPESAWVCVYDATDVGPGADGDGATYGWTRSGEAAQVPSSQLAGISRSLDELAPAPRHQMCTADLGPRWMLVSVVGTDLTGVVVDGFGCGDVRLTDEPFEVVPGEASSSGTVPGVLAGPDDLLAALQAITGR